MNLKPRIFAEELAQKVCTCSELIFFLFFKGIKFLIYLGRKRVLQSYKITGRGREYNDECLHDPNIAVNHLYI